MLHVVRVKLRNQRSKRRKLFTKISLKFKEENNRMLYLEQSLYGTENCAFRKVNQKHLESFEFSWRRVEFSWVHHVRYEEVLHRVKKKRNVLLNTKQEES